MLVLPGWFVVRTGRGDITVLNEKEVRKSFGGEFRIPEPQLRRIIHQLSDKCRLAADDFVSRY